MRKLGILGLCMLAITTAAGQSAQPNGLSKWSYDEVHLKNGASMQGLILAEGAEGIKFQSVSRLPGRATVTLTGLITKGEISRIKRLSDADRAALKERLAELDPSGSGERKRMESLELVAADWPGKPGAAKSYESDYFTLFSTGSDELTRRSAVRLEQIYAAFTRFLPPTVKDAMPTQLMLATQEEEYKALLGQAGELPLLHPAVFDPVRNRVLCGSNLKQLGAELQTARIHHSQQMVSLETYQENVRKLYKPPELKRYLDLCEAEKKRIYAADRANGAGFDQATRRIFAILYHEAFHAYVGTFVYPALKSEDVKAGKGAGELPRWLNEGLAQVFETAVVEAGELRADWPDLNRMNRAQDWMKGKSGGPLVPLGDLLRLGKETFLASHRDQQGAAERAYLTSWALAYYLTFDRHVIGTEGFRKYLIAVNSGGDPLAAFAELVGQEIPAFEKDWYAFLVKLQRDGTVGK